MTNLPLSFSENNDNKLPSYEDDDISTMVGKHIQVQWNMSDGSLEWFNAFVQSCSSSEAVIVYDDGESYLLAKNGETEWRPIPVVVLDEEEEVEETITVETAMKQPISTITTTNKAVAHTQPGDHKSLSHKKKSSLSLQSLIQKLNRNSASVRLGDNKTFEKGKQIIKVPSRSSFSDKRTAGKSSESVRSSDNKTSENAKHLANAQTRSPFSDERTVSKKSISSEYNGSLPELTEENHRIVTKDSPRKRKAPPSSILTPNEQVIKKQKLQQPSLANPDLQGESALSLLHKKTCMERAKSRREKFFSMRRLPPPNRNRIAALGTKRPVLFDPNVENEAMYFY